MPYRNSGHVNMDALYNNDALTAIIDKAVAARLKPLSLADKQFLAQLPLRDGAQLQRKYKYQATVKDEEENNVEETTESAPQDKTQDGDVAVPDVDKMLDDIDLIGDDNGASMDLSEAAAEVDTRDELDMALDNMD